MEQYPRRKRTRLSAANYANPNEICSVTIAVKGRQPVFADPGVASDAIGVLRSLAAARPDRRGAQSDFGNIEARTEAATKKLGNM